MSFKEGESMTNRKILQMYEMKQKALKYYEENGVPKKMENVLNKMFLDNPIDVYGYLANYFDEFSSPPKIERVLASQVWNSSGKPTIKVDMYCCIRNHEKLIASTVSSGTESNVCNLSKVYEKEVEAVEQLESVETAISFINGDLGSKIQNEDPAAQKHLDEIIRSFIGDLQVIEDEEWERKAVAEAEEQTILKAEQTLQDEVKTSGKKSTSTKGKKKAHPVDVIPDEPPEKCILGSPAGSALSKILCITGSLVKDKPLYKYIARLRFGKTPESYKLPLPMITILQCGNSSPGKLKAFHEIMLIPKPGVSVRTTIEYLVLINKHVLKSLETLTKAPLTCRNVSSIGAMMGQIDKPEQALDLVLDAIRAAQLVPGEDFHLGINCSAHKIFSHDKGKYEVANGLLKSYDEMADFWVDLVTHYPTILALIDPLRKQENQQWTKVWGKISGHCYIIGDHCYHRPGRLKDETISESFKTSAAILRFQNKTTVMELLECADKLEDADNEVVLTACEGDTNDSFLVDLAVGMSAKFLKIGGLQQGERIAKLNRLIEIEDHLEREGELAHHGYQFAKLMKTAPSTEVSSKQNESSVGATAIESETINSTHD